MDLEIAAPATSHQVSRLLRIPSSPRRPRLPHLAPCLATHKVKKGDVADKVSDATMPPEWFGVRGKVHAIRHRRLI